MGRSNLTDRGETPRHASIAADRPRRPGPIGDIPGSGQEVQAPAIARGVDYLRKAGGATSDAGEAALAALALIKAEVPADDPGLLACLDRTRARFDGSVYKPGRTGGTEIYEAGVIALAYANADPAAYKSQLDAIARYLTAKQNGNGSWDYSNRTAGDSSISQYAILGLWEAENAGVRVPAKVWDSAARFFLGSQASNGGWRYHPDETAWLETVGMTAAGCGSLLICQKQMARYRKGRQRRAQSLPRAAGRRRDADPAKIRREDDRHRDPTTPFDAASAGSAST